jgi:hypothetical protein
MGKPTHEPEDDMLVDTTRVVRWAGPVFVLCSLVLIPWIVYLGYSLPSRQVSRHYNIAWVGYDVLELIALGATGYFALRRSRYLALSAAAAATLLVVDAWFDVMTSPRHQLPMAVTLAVVIELPLAAVCAWLSYHTEHLTEQSIILLLRRDPRQERAPAGPPASRSP